jgi:hypothetical protein
MLRSRQRLFLALVAVIMGSVALESEAQPWAGGKGCMDGGAGSESCKFSLAAGGEGYGCSVSCNVGYYSCCTLSGCTCIKEPKSKK